MLLSKRDATILQKILKYCDDIDKTIELFGASEDILRENSIYMNALAMCVLQIGELTTHLSTEFRNTFSEIPWKDIRGMRNVAAHHYGDFSAKYLWQTVEEDIPVLRQFCEKQLSGLE